MNAMKIAMSWMQSFGNRNRRFSNWKDYHTDFRSCKTDILFSAYVTSAGPPSPLNALIPMMAVPSPSTITAMRITPLSVKPSLPWILYPSSSSISLTGISRRYVIMASMPGTGNRTNLYAAPSKKIGSPSSKVLTTGRPAYPVPLAMPPEMHQMRTSNDTGWSIPQPPAYSSRSTLWKDNA